MGDEPGKINVHFHLLVRTLASFPFFSSVEETLGNLDFLNLSAKSTGERVAAASCTIIISWRWNMGNGSNYLYSKR